MQSKVIRLYTGPDGESHIGESTVDFLESHSGKARQWALMKATGVAVRESDGPYEYPRHNAPRRQFVITVQGEWEVEMGDGTIQPLKPGDILLAEDTTGKGHISRSTSQGLRQVIIVTLD